jgi:hypothetical protein
MEYLIGVGLALAICTFAAAVGLDRQRAFYATMVLVVATYYVLFAVLGGTLRSLLSESLVAIAFFALAAFAFKKNEWLIVAGLVAMAYSIASTTCSSTTPGSPPSGRASVFHLMSWPEDFWRRCWCDVRRLHCTRSNAMLQSRNPEERSTLWMRTPGSWLSLWARGPDR